MSCRLADGCRRAWTGSGKLFEFAPILVAIEGIAQSPEPRPVAVIDRLLPRLIERHFTALHAIESDDHSCAVPAQAATDKDWLRCGFHSRKEIADRKSTRLNSSHSQISYA